MCQTLSLSLPLFPVTMEKNPATGLLFLTQNWAFRTFSPCSVSLLFEKRKSEKYETAFVCSFQLLYRPLFVCPMGLEFSGPMCRSIFNSIVRVLSEISLTLLIHSISVEGDILLLFSLYFFFVFWLCVDGYLGMAFILVWPFGFAQEIGIGSWFPTVSS